MVQQVPKQVAELALRELPGVENRKLVARLNRQRIRRKRRKAATGFATLAKCLFTASALRVVATGEPGPGVP